MSSRYRVEYHLKAHRKDELIDWIKGLLAVPFVLHSASMDGAGQTMLRKRYSEVFRAVEELIQEECVALRSLSPSAVLPGNRSRLAQLVPSVGPFFTPLPLEAAFLSEDRRRAISARSMVAPSFNDIRHILNTAQILQMQRAGCVKLVTFDGDVTLYEDGGSLSSTDKVVPCLLALLRRGICVGIVTAAGYDEAEKYMDRLHGLMDALRADDTICAEYKRNLAVMGGESNYLFRYDPETHDLRKIEESEWLLPIMREWADSDITETLDLAESLFNGFKASLNLPEEATVIRKPRAVGIVPGNRFNSETRRTIRVKMDREQLEEMVLTLQQRLERFAPATRVQFSCFDGGSDVWCDIGGKDLGVRALQRFYCPSHPIQPRETLHVGDQFAPRGSANDFKARLSGSTLWIASPQETVAILHQLIQGFD
ncbi:LAMI_0D10902g1_1 [Lachancea mirantina]|uniref:IMP-specific 5'-nucleotidase 1 n=1 Tax=Lachancea mirantina TaxID=1230905 RepID=A0A1G4JEW8_9SACH|nr:LAMI_0D10902g1_1 [Lachancea mirantina]